MWHGGEWGNVTIFTILRFCSRGLGQQENLGVSGSGLERLSLRTQEGVFEPPYEILSNCLNLFGAGVVRLLVVCELMPASRSDLGLEDDGLLASPAVGEPVILELPSSVDTQNIQIVSIGELHRHVAPAVDGILGVGNNDELAYATIMEQSSQFPAIPAGEEVLILAVTRRFLEEMARDGVHA